MLIDLQRLSRAGVLEDNLVSVLARAHGMREVKDVAPVVDEALRVMRSGSRRELREVFIPWFRELGKRFGVDLKFLEDEEMLAKVEAEGEVRLLVQDRLQAQLDKIKAASREQGFAQGLEERRRDLLRRTAARRFGAETAQQLDPLLAATEDPERLSDVGSWITDCATGEELLGRLRNADQAARTRSSQVPGGSRRRFQRGAPLERPSGAGCPGTPSFTMESQVQNRVQALYRAGVSKDNLLLILVRAYGMRGVEDIAPLVDDALCAMRSGQRRELREVFFPWFQEVVAGFGIDLKFLEDEEMLAKLEAEGEVRLLVQDRLQAQLDKMKAESREQGREDGFERGFEQGFEQGFKRSFNQGRAEERGEALERERALLYQLIALRFGAETAQQLDPLLVATKDPDHLLEIGYRIADCATGEELLKWLQNAD